MPNLDKNGQAADPTEFVKLKVLWACRQDLNLLQNIWFCVIGKCLDKVTVN